MDFRKITGKLLEIDEQNFSKTLLVPGNPLFAMLDSNADQFLEYVAMPTRNPVPSPAGQREAALNPTRHWYTIAAYLRACAHR